MREPLHSWVAVAPLVLMHALLVAWVQPPVRAAAAGWVLGPLGALGVSELRASLLVAAVLLGVAAVVSARRWRRGDVAFRVSVLPLVWFEGVAWGLVLHLAANGLGNEPAAAPVPLGPLDELALALGAGIYEELVFRVAIHGVLLLALRALLARALEGRGREALARIGAVAITSAVFAAAHWIGPESADAAAFAFRFAAALFLTSLLSLRGFGVAVTCHVVYDLAVAAGLG